MQALKVQAMCRAESICKPLPDNDLHQHGPPRPRVRQIRPATRAEQVAAHGVNPSSASSSRNRLSAAVRTWEIRDSVTWSTSAICRSVSSSK